MLSLTKPLPLTEAELAGVTITKLPPGIARGADFMTKWGGWRNKNNGLGKMPLAKTRGRKFKFKNKNKKGWY
jgi:hypothetical protein